MPGKKSFPVTRVYMNFVECFYAYCAQIEIGKKYDYRLGSTNMIYPFLIQVVYDNFTFERGKL